MMPAQEELARDFLTAAPTAAVRTAAEAAERGERPPAAIAIGVFDGLHVGHRDLIARTVADARARGCISCAVTFDPDPDAVLAREPARHLMTTADRIAALAASGVDEVVVVPFTRELAALDHARFFDEVLLPALDVRAVHVGSDFRLGAGGASTVSVMAAWCAERGIVVTGHDLVLDDGAAAELGRRYLVRGQVTAGRGAGTEMGFPTANIACDPACQMPADGVYSALACVGGTVWPAAVNVGLPPTYRDDPASATLEANLIGFTGDLYHQPIALAFDAFLRPSRVFPSTDELIKTVLGNIETIRARFGETGVAIDR